MHDKLIIIFTLSALAGCQTVTVPDQVDFTTVIQSKSGAVEPVNFHINVEYATATTASDSYRGKIISLISQSKGTTYTSRYTKKDNQTTFHSSPTDSTNYHPSAKGVLVSDSGRSMECDLTVTHPQLGVLAGAVGTCTLSDNRKIPISY